MQTYKMSVINQGRLPPSSIRPRWFSFSVWFDIVDGCRSLNWDVFLRIWVNFPSIVRTKTLDRLRLCWLVVQFASYVGCDCRLDDDLWTFPFHCTSDPFCRIVRLALSLFPNLLMKLLVFVFFLQWCNNVALCDRFNVHKNDDRQIMLIMLKWTH